MALERVDRRLARDAKERLGVRALLVRPDGFVAWATDTTPDPDEVVRASGRWFADQKRSPGAASR